MDRFPTVDFITISGWYHVFAFAALLPWIAWRSRGRVQNASLPLPAPVKHFQSQIVLLTGFGVMSLLTALSQHLDLFPRAWPSVWAVGAGIVMYVVVVTVMRPHWRRAVAARKRVVRLFMADTPVERRWWVAVAVLAGVSEEITWRGVQFALLTYLFGSPWIGALVCATLFGLGHIVQGWRSVILITGFALAFQTLVAFSGSLYVAMLVHAAYDVTAGFTYGRLGRAFRCSESQAGEGVGSY